ncbi:MAG: UDP-2,3-diacylglucosamine diphosphatase [Bacteroidetes bacterium]|nr:UDP-2,3-diacylglucosamine diphosphatase [Bacteroidota bacterium]
MEAISSKTEQIKIDTLILSDIHLGSDVSRADIAADILELYSFKRLVLLGDIFDDLNFKRLKKAHWKFLSIVRKLSNPKKNIEVIWVEGNHDEGLGEIMALMIGIEIHKEITWRTAGKKFLAIHGHQFDRFLNENVVISNIASFVYDKMQKVGKEKQKLARYVKKKSKGWLRLAGKIAHGAVEHARHRGAEIVICGHTHLATETPHTEKGIRYYNTGCFTDIPSSYIIISENGDVAVKHA